MVFQSPLAVFAKIRHAISLKEIDRTPCSNNPLMTSGSIVSFSSISRTFGATTSFANRRTVTMMGIPDSQRFRKDGGLPDSRNISSSSEKVSREFSKVGREHENDLLKGAEYSNLTSLREEITAYRVEGARHRLVKRNARDATSRWYMLDGSTRQCTHVIPQIPGRNFKLQP